MGFDPTDEKRGFRDPLGEGVGDAASLFAMKSLAVEECPWGIARDRELGVGDEVGVLHLRRHAEDPFQISFEVPDDGVDLGEDDLHGASISPGGIAALAPYSATISAADSVRTEFAVVGSTLVSNFGRCRPLRTTNWVQKVVKRGHFARTYSQLGLETCEFVDTFQERRSELGRTESFATVVLAVVLRYGRSEA